MNLLDRVGGSRRVRQVFRLAVTDKNEFISTLELDDKGQEELKDLLHNSGYKRGLDGYLDAVFRPKRRIKRRTRFSDGSFPVFYCSLEIATAIDEVRYWIPQFMGKPKAARTAYYQEVACTFDGIEKDLRGMVGTWPNLIHKTNYDFCNKLGAEAIRSNVDAFATPSVRRSSGSNLPIFSRSAAVDAELISVLAFRFDPANGQVTSRTSASQ